MASGTFQKYADGTDSGWLDVPLNEGVTITSGSLKYRKVGNLVFVDASDMIGITTNGTKASIPAGFRPSHTVYTTLIIAYPKYAPSGMVRIYGGGSINIQFDPNITVGSNSNVCFTFVYPV